MWLRSCHSIIAVLWKGVERVRPNMISSTSEFRDDDVFLGRSDLNHCPAWKFCLKGFENFVRVFVHEASKLWSFLARSIFVCSRRDKWHSISAQRDLFENALKQKSDPFAFSFRFLRRVHTVRSVFFLDLSEFLRRPQYLYYVEANQSGSSPESLGEGKHILLK